MGAFKLLLLSVLLCLICTLGAAQAQQPALRFIPLAPCRVADTRNVTGPLGGPSIGARSSRNFAIPSSSCGVPSTAAAYSLNITAVPWGVLGYATVWPTGQQQPNVSTLNSIDGRVKANAAIVPAGTGGAISVYATDTTDVVLDINGYFVPATDPSALAFFPLPPCRVVDTRNATGPLGGPYLAAQQGRSFPVLTSNCNIPSTAQAYSLNFTVVPWGILGYLTTWPSGTQQPNVSTLNALTGTVTANAAIVPAGDGGAISAYAKDNTDVIIDINGYFAPSTSGNDLSLFALPPCRILDTRLTVGWIYGTFTVDTTASPCGIVSSAQAVVLNATVVPGPQLGFLTLWPAGQVPPNVSTLNSLDGQVTSNMAIVPTTSGAINAYGKDPTSLVLDTSGYFARSIIPPTLVSIAVSPAIPAIPIAMTQRFIALGTYSDGSSQDVTSSATWTSSATSVATMSGSTATGVAFGTTTVTATVGSVSGTTTLTVGSSSLTGISISPATVSLPVNTTQQLTVLGTFSNGSTRDVTASATWSSSASSAASVDAVGLLTVASAGSDVTITAAVGSKTATAIVHVTSATLQAILVTPFADTQSIGVEEQFTAAGLFSDGGVHDLAGVTWASNATDVASVSTSGVATTKNAGNAAISATAGAVTGSATLTVTSVTLTSISVTPASASLPVGFPQQLVATGTFSDSSTKVLAAVTWASWAPGVASINSSGMASALTAGTTSISATSAGISGSTTLAVTSTTLKSIAITPIVPSMVVGQTLQFAATATFQDNSTVDVTQSAGWSAFSPSVVSINDTGLATALTAGAFGGIGVGYGTAATSTTATVSPATLTSLAISPNNPTVAVGATQQLMAVGTFSDTSTHTVGAATWSSDNPTIVSVSAAGVVTGRHSGTTTVTATYAATSATAAVTVP